MGLTIASGAFAEPVLVDAQFPGEVYNGQKVNLSLTYEWPKKEGWVEFKTPEVIDLINFKVEDQYQSLESRNSDSGPISRLSITYQLQATDLGQGKILSFTILYRKPHASTWSMLKTPNVMVEIKQGVPIKKILKLTGITIAIILPFAFWFIRARTKERKHEVSFQNDPKQQIYANAAIKFSRFISGYTVTFLEGLLSEWSSEILKVIMACYDIPGDAATPHEILKELRTRDIPADSIREIEDIFKRLALSKQTAAEMINERPEIDLAEGDWDLERDGQKPETRASISLEKLRLTLYGYTKSKITVGPSDFSNYMK